MWAWRMSSWLISEASTLEPQAFIWSKLIGAKETWNTLGATVRSREKAVAFLSMVSISLEVISIVSKGWASL